MTSTISTVSVQSVIEQLERAASEGTRKTYIRHGHKPDQTLGVKVADIKTIAKGIRGEHELSYELYDTGILEAMYLAAIVARGSQMDARRIRDWAVAADGFPMVAEFAVPWLAVEHANAFELANEWIGSDSENLSSIGWSTYIGLLKITPDSLLDLAEIEGHLTTISKTIHSVPNRTRWNMNSFVIAAAEYVAPAVKAASSSAEIIGEVYVDVGPTACKIPVASERIAQMLASKKFGIKRKTIRC